MPSSPNKLISLFKDSSTDFSCFSSYAVYEAFIFRAHCCMLFFRLQIIYDILTSDSTNCQQPKNIETKIISSRLIKLMYPFMCSSLHLYLLSVLAVLKCLYNDFVPCLLHRSLHSNVCVCVS